MDVTTSEADALRVRGQAYDSATTVYPSAAATDLEAAFHFVESPNAPAPQVADSAGEGAT